MTSSGATWRLACLVNLLACSAGLVKAPSAGGGGQAGTRAGSGGSEGATGGKGGGRGTGGRIGTEGSTGGVGALGAAGASATGGAGGGSTASGGRGGCTFLFCDDFESSASLDTNKWSTVVGYNVGDSVTVQSGMAAHGNRAVRAHLVETEGGLALLKESKTFPTLADAFWGRMYFYTTVAPNVGHTATILVHLDSSLTPELEIGIGGGLWQLNYYKSTGPGQVAEFPGGSSTAIPRNRWACVEWHFDRHAVTPIEVYVEGSLAASYTAESSLMSTSLPFVWLGLGIKNTGANPPLNDVYIDDVAIDSQRIFCLP